MGKKACLPRSEDSCRLLRCRLSSVTPWKVDRSHLYPREKQGDISVGPPRRRDGGLSSESNSVVRRFSPSPPDLALLSFALRRLRTSTCPLRRRIADVLEIWTVSSLAKRGLSIVPTCVLDLDSFSRVLCRNGDPIKNFASATFWRSVCMYL